MGHLPPKHLAIAAFTFTLAFSSCKKDVKEPEVQPTPSVPCPATVTDIDGNEYNTVRIGNQCWCKENLKTTHYNNGEQIPTGLDAAQWITTDQGAVAVYDDDPVNEAIYGLLYNWYAVDDGRGICPNGWHVPTDAEWTVLTNYLGGENIAGGKMKTTTLWNAPNTGATNESGCSGLPGGNRDIDDGYFNYLGRTGYWWSASERFAESAWERHLEYNKAGINRSSPGKSNGFCVRCIMD